jgi:hypothetical protein
VAKKTSQRRKSRDFPSFNLKDENEDGLNMEMKTDAGGDRAKWGMGTL